MWVTSALVWIFLLLNSSIGLSQWIRKSDALRKRGECPSILYQGKMYVFGGFGEHPNFEKDNEVYNPAIDTWTLIAPFPTGKEISHQGIVLVDDQVWHIGGRTVNADGPVSSMVLIYDITNNTWRDGPSIKDPATGQLLPLGGGGAVLLGRTIHVFGGFGPTICIDQNKYHLTIDVDQYKVNPSLSWENKLAPMPLPRNHLSSTVLGGKIYAFGGQLTHGCGGPDVAYAHVYDPITNTWTRLTDLPAARSHAESSTFPLDGELFYIGGQGPSNVAQNTVLIFTPESNNGLGAWRNATEYVLPNTYYGLASKVIGNNFIFSHGALSAITNERFETYSRTLSRNIPFKLGFVAPCFTQSVDRGSTTVIKNIIYTVEGEKQYSLSSNAAWLQVTKNGTGTAIQTGVPVEVTINTTGLSDGSYSATVTATASAGGTAYTNSSFCVNITVVQNNALISDISATSGRTYNIGQLAVGTTVYTDRAYQVTSVPADINNAPYIRTANDDKYNTSTSLLSFNLSKEATVYIAYDPRGTVLPQWLSSWQKLTTQLGVNDSKITHMDLYMKVFPAGRVTLGGNLASPASGALNNYIVIAQPLSYTLTVSTIGSGSVTRSPDQTSYTSGSAVSLTAIPASGQLFTGWSGAATGTTNPLTITMDANKSITANFSPPAINYNLSVTINGSGTVTKNPDQPNYASGSTVSLTANATSGQQFIGWSGDLNGTVNPVNVTMNGNKSITANFAAPTTKSLLFTQSSQTAEVEQGKSQTLLEYISTSDNSVVSANLTASDDFGNVPNWLSVNNKIINGINYTTGSEISFNLDATNLSIGTYTANVTATAAGYTNDTLKISLVVKSVSNNVLSNFKVNFQDSATQTPAGWLRDYGQSFMLRNSAFQESGYTFGWLKRSDRTPLDLTKNGRKTQNPADILLATLMHMQGNDVTNFKGTPIEGVWEAQVVNGNYDVTVSVGDGTYINSKHSINIEGVNAISGFVPTTAVKFKSATATVSVADGLLTIDAIGGVNTKINYVIIKPSEVQRPSVIAVNPENGSVNISENTSVSTSILNLPNGGINNATITSANVFLKEESTGAIVPSNVNGTGGGDAITLVPASPLKLSTTYVFSITSGVKDLSGSSIIPYSSKFTTGSASTSDVITARFNKIALPNAAGRHSSLSVGPDGKLYALTIDGIIKRFSINSDGTLGTPEMIYSLQDATGTRQQRLAIGLAFDPASTASNLIAWVTHSSYVFLDGPQWDGKLTKLSGSNLQTAQDVLVNLPRSSKDHLTNSISFGPDGALYFTQGSLSAMGRADQTWNLRNEVLLSAAVLRLDPSKLSTIPLDVKTNEGGGSYNPYTANAALTIYASGIRNAYDLLWHSNGNLYVATNGSAAGGNTPASIAGRLRPDGTTYNGPVVPALSNVQQTQKDFLFRITKGGYYGHPNAARGEFVMNGGNPTSNLDPAQVSAYPVGTLPDVNWKGYSFDFQANASPNGTIEYKSNIFNGALKNKLMVVRYSQHDDIITLGLGGSGNDVISSTEGSGIEGFSGFIDPLDLVEDVNTGNIYVSEYGGQGAIVLLKPNTSGPTSPATMRINTGGGSVTVSTGTFSADAYFSGQTATSTFNRAIDNTTDDILYINYRKAFSNGGIFDYRIPVVNATYTVKLHFAELFFTTAGSRVFNVNAEGSSWLTDYDIFVSAGGMNKAKVETRNVTVTDGYLDLNFVSLVDKAIISAIEVIPAVTTTVTKAVVQPFDEVIGKDVLYPNPVRDIVYIKVNETDNQLNAIITNSLGSMIHKSKVYLSNSQTVRVNVASLRPGLYYITLESKRGRKTYKFFKE